MEETLSWGRSVLPFALPPGLPRMKAGWLSTCWWVNCLKLTGTCPGRCSFVVAKAWVYLCSAFWNHTIIKLKRMQLLLDGLSSKHFYDPRSPILRSWVSQALREWNVTSRRPSPAHVVKPTWPWWNQLCQVGRLSALETTLHGWSLTAKVSGTRKAKPEHKDNESLCCCNNQIILF